METPEIFAESGGNFQPAPAGNHAGICVGMALMGTITETYEGHAKEQKKIAIAFELPDKLKEDGEPFVVWKKFTLSTAPNSNLRALLEAWRGSAFTPEEAKKVNISKILGVVGLVNITHDTTKAGKKFANLSNVTPLPEAMPDPVQKTQGIFFSIDITPFDTEAFNRLPKWYQDEIKTSSEYKALSGAPGATTTQTAATVTKKTVPF
jgi:hypothetical protein